MTPSEFRISLEHLARSQRGLARLLTRDDRLVRRLGQWRQRDPRRGCRVASSACGLPRQAPAAVINSDRRET